jgi:3D-(3,5/4)-trihydroxycyclohexane-1,2-dione acylhydrolase (decyclizing)
VLSENHGYQCIRNLQMNRAGYDLATEFKMRNPETKRLDGDYAKIDFAQNAQSMGARTWSVKTPSDLRNALQEARAETRPCVIVVETEKHRFIPGSGVWWDVAVSETSGDPVTKKLRKAFEDEREKLQRFYY